MIQDIVSKILSQIEYDEIEYMNKFKPILKEKE